MKFKDSKQKTKLILVYLGLCAVLIILNVLKVHI